VEPDALYRDGGRSPHQEIVFQLVLLTSLAGVAGAARDDLVDAVRRRVRNYPQRLDAAPRQDALVQEGVRGGGAGAAAARAVVRGAGAGGGAGLGALPHGGGDDGPGGGGGHGSVGHGGGGHADPGHGGGRGDGAGQHHAAREGADGDGAQ